MGLCKCPKRRVTNQFCFEHRVNVCEFCIVQNHPKVTGHFLLTPYCNTVFTRICSSLQCVVQSYLQWLQDSDYNPNCHFCDQDLSDEECIRLACYRKACKRHTAVFFKKKIILVLNVADVFHWVCLDKWARSLPSNTAPAGYTCPSCQECIFSPEKLQSPVADALK
jgi:hypothetical protein